MIYALLISLTYFILLYLNETRQISPDGKRYFHAGGGNQLYSPFYLRWLLPYICKQNDTLWSLFTLLPTFLLPVLTYILLDIKGYSESQSLIGCALVCGLNGVYLINYISKYLTDAFGMMCMLLSVISFQLEILWLGILLSGIGTMANEKVFIYTALASWNPLALIGGIPLLIRYLISKPAKLDVLQNEQYLDKPIKTAHGYHKGKYFSMVLVWGVCLIGFQVMTLQ